MKAGVQTLSGSQTVEKSLSTVLAELFKARLTSLVLLTTGVGYYLGSRGPPDMARLLNTLAGTGRPAAGAGDDVAGADGESPHEPARRGDAGELPLRLYAAQAPDDAQHDHRRDSRRAAAIDGVDGGHGAGDGGRLGAVRGAVLLAVATLLRDRVDVSR